MLYSMGLAESQSQFTTSRILLNHAGFARLPTILGSGQQSMSVDKRVKSVGLVCESQAYAKTDSVAVVKLQYQLQKDDSSILIEANIIK